VSLNNKWLLWLGAFSALTVSSELFALDPQKNFTQYTRTVWTQAQGLPQDTIRAIVQTNDGYLWLGTREGLARFDGYDFASFTKDDGALPSNGVTTLATGRNNALWIGTLEGVSLYQNGRFRIFTERDGLPPDPVNSMAEDSSGALWVVSDNRLFRLPTARLQPSQAKALRRLRRCRWFTKTRPNKFGSAAPGA
jgi:ligand-binding sensor domain-containing protein